MHPTQALIDLRTAAASCTLCPLADTRTQVVFGVGSTKADLLLVGEAPGREEDLEGVPFVGRSGQLLESLITDVLGMRRNDYYITNVIKCRPPGNRDPKSSEIETCKPYLDQQIEFIDPLLVVTLGNFATQLLLETSLGIGRLHGKTYPFRRGHILPTYHPAAALRSGSRVVELMRSDLKQAKLLLGVGHS